MLTAEQKAVKARLNTYREIRLERDHLAEMLKDLESCIYAAGVPPYDGQPRSPGVGDPTGNNATKHSTLLDKYRAKIAELDAKGIEFENWIAPLSDVERRLLRYRYLGALTWEQIALRMDYCLRHLFTLHKTCLDKLAAADPDDNIPQF